MEPPYRQTSLGGAAPATPAPPTAAPVSIGTFMDRLEQQGVTFALIDGVLSVEAPLGALSEAQRHEIAARRGEIERLVRVALGPYQPVVATVEACPAQLTFVAVA